MIAKVPDRGVRYELDPAGRAATSWDARGDLRAGASVDAVLRLGVFGAFGYCWLLDRIKPTTTTQETQGRTASRT